eukprot:gene35284-47414_t
MNPSSSLLRLLPRSPARENRDLRHLRLRALTFLFTLTFPLTLTSASAEEVRSRPVGYLVQTIPAGQTRAFSVPFDAPTSSQSNTLGKLTAIGADYLENSAAAWTPGAFSTPDAPYFVRLTSGPHAGRTFRITTPANTATRLSVADDGLGLADLGLTVGPTFEIIPGDTLASFFGTAASGDTLVVQGAGDPLAADLVQVWGGA